jgi:hypothetical protein
MSRDRNSSGVRQMLVKLRRISTRIRVGELAAVAQRVEARRVRTVRRRHKAVLIHRVRAAHLPPRP